MLQEGGRPISREARGKKYDQKKGTMPVVPSVLEKQGRFEGKEEIAKPG